MSWCDSTLQCACFIHNITNLTFLARGGKRKAGFDADICETVLHDETFFSVLSTILTHSIIIPHPYPVDDAS